MKTQRIDWRRQAQLQAGGAVLRRWERGQRGEQRADVRGRREVPWFLVGWCICKIGILNFLSEFCKLFCKFCKFWAGWFSVVPKPHLSTTCTYVCIWQHFSSLTYTRFAHVCTVCFCFTESLSMRRYGMDPQVFSGRRDANQFTSSFRFWQVFGLRGRRRIVHLEVSQRHRRSFRSSYLQLHRGSCRAEVVFQSSATTIFWKSTPLCEPCFVIICNEIL